MGTRNQSMAHGIEGTAQSSVSTRTVRGGALTAAAAWTKFLVQFGSTLLIARLLGPFEYGVAAIVIVLGGAAEILRNSGLTALAVRRNELDATYASRLHRLTLVTALVAAAAVSLSGEPLAVAFGDPRYVAFAPVLGLVFVFIGLGSIQGAVLARHLRFRQVALGDFVAALIACSCALGLAFAGAGAWALVVQPAIMAFVQTLIVWVLSPWRPGWRASGPPLSVTDRAFVRDVSTVNVLNYLAGNLDNVLVGLTAGPLGAGLYVQAYQLMILPLQQVTGPLQKVMVPALSRIRSERERFRAYYRALLTTVTLVLWPFFAVVLVFRSEIIGTLFGEAWLGAAPILGFLVVAGAANAVGYPSTWLFVVTGQARRQLLWVLATRPMLIASFFVGLPWGVVGVAVAYSLTTLLLVVPEFMLARHAASLRLGDLVGPTVWPGVLAALAASCAFFVRHLGPPSPRGFVFLLELAGTVLIVGAAAAMVPAVRRHLAAIRSAMRER